MTGFVSHPHSHTSPSPARSGSFAAGRLRRPCLPPGRPPHRTIGFVRGRSASAAVLAAGPSAPPGRPQLPEIKARVRRLEHDEQTPDPAVRGRRNREEGR